MSGKLLLVLFLASSLLPTTVQVAPSFGEEFYANSDEGRKHITEKLQSGIKLFDKRAERLIDYRFAAKAEPDSIEMLFATDGARGRFEIDFRTDEKTIRCVRILSNAMLIKYDPPSITLANKHEEENRWRELCAELTAYEAPFAFNMGEQMNAKEISSFLRDFLAGTAEVDNSLDRIKTGKITVSMSVEGDLVTYSIKEHDDGPNYEFYFTVDHQKGGVLTRWKDLCRGSKNDYSDEIKLEYLEVSSGLWMPKSATRVQESTTGTTTSSVSFSDYEIGGLVFPDHYFDLESLGVPVGTHVEDHRVQPISIFTYGTAGGNVSLLEQAAQEQASSPASINK